MLAGYAAIDITPAIGSVLNGFIARLSPSTGIDAPLFARALWLEDTHTKSLIISLDLLGISPSFADLMVKGLSNRLHVPETNVILACSHTHSGPMAAPLRGLGQADEEYLSVLTTKIYEAAQLAAMQKKSVKLFWGSAPVEIGVNRRVIDPADGKAILGRNPDGPRDNLVRVMHLLGDDSSIILFEHACHPYCLGGEYTLISPDFWGHTASTLAEKGHQAIYLNGCAGNIATLNAYQGPQAARQQGQRLAEAVLEAINQSSLNENPVLRAGSIPIHIPYDDIPPLEQLQADLDKEDRTVRQEEKQNQEIQTRLRTAWNEWLVELKQFTESGSGLPPIKSRISVMRIGNGAIVSLPGEVFYQIGESIAQKLKADPACVAAYGHGYIGYVPDAEAFKLGGYEVEESHRYVGLWRVDPQTGALMKDQVLKLWQNLGGTIR